MHPIHNELNEAWRSYFIEAKLEVPNLHALRAFRPKSIQAVLHEQPEALQPWFAIQEVIADLLVNLHLALNGNKSGPPLDRFRQVPWSLVGAASGFGSSLLISCAAGYDVPAKAQLRTYTEAMLLLVATVHDEAFAAEYHAANTDSLVIDFWHKKASPKRLHGRIMDIERQLGFQETQIASLTDWRRREYEVLSQSSHLSFLAATMTCLSPSMEDMETLRLRLFGGPTLASCRTLAYAVTSTWHCLRLVHKKLLTPGSDLKALLALREPDPILAMIVAGWRALETVVPNCLGSDRVPR